MLKAAIYIEQKAKKTGEPLYWAGYVYATEEVNRKDFSFVKNAFDQWGKKVKVYKAQTKTHLETPGGVKSTDLVVLF